MPKRKFLRFLAAPKAPKRIFSNFHLHKGTRKQSVRFSPAPKTPQWIFWDFHLRAEGAQDKIFEIFTCAEGAREKFFEIFTGAGGAQNFCLTPLCLRRRRPRGDSWDFYLHRSRPSLLKKIVQVSPAPKTTKDFFLGFLPAPKAPKRNLETFTCAERGQEKIFRFPFALRTLEREFWELYGYLHWRRPSEIFQTFTCAEGTREIKFFRFRLHQRRPRENFWDFYLRQRRPRENWDFPLRRRRLRKTFEIFTCVEDGQEKKFKPSPTSRALKSKFWIFYLRRRHLREIFQSFAYAEGAQKKINNIHHKSW